jgi:hypothetical protein
MLLWILCANSYSTESNPGQMPNLTQAHIAATLGGNSQITDGLPLLPP